MKIGKIKQTKAESFRDYPEPKEMSSVIETKPPLRERAGEKVKRTYFAGKKRAAGFLLPSRKTQEEKQLLKQQKYAAKIKSETLKAELAEAKQRRRAASPMRHIGPGISKVFGKPDRPARARIEQTSLQLEKIRRDREMMRQRQTYEREQQAKFGVRPEGDGEMPYYKPEHKKLLPKKGVPKIGITNHEYVPKKKSFKDEVL